MGKIGDRFKLRISVIILNKNELKFSVKRLREWIKKQSESQLCTA